MSENVTSKFRVDISDLKRNIAEANRQVKQYRAELLNANAGMKKGEETADSLSRKIEAQSKIVEAEKAKLQALKDELAKYEDTVRKGEDIVADLSKKHEDAAKAFGEDSEEAQKLAKQLKQAQEAQERNVKAADELRTKIINQDTAVKNAEAQVKQYSGALNDLQKEEKETGDAAEKTTNGGLNAFAVALGNLASQVITKAVQGLGNLVKSVIDTGKAFDSSMSKVKAISGATDEEMEKLTARAQELGASTKFTSKEVADAFGYMGMAGWKAADMIGDENSVGGIEGILNLAAAAGADLATTSDIVTDSLTAFGQSAGEAGRLADIMAAAAANSNTNVEMMGETFKYAASLAGSMGYSMEDTAIATGLMANSGIKATQAGTSLRAMMTRMAAPTKDSATAMEALGLKLDDGHGNMKSLMQVMQELRASFGDLKMSQADFSQEQNKLNAALESGEMDEDEFNEAQEELIKRAYGAEGAMKAQYASMLAGKNGLSGFLAIVNASEEDFDKLTDSIYNSNGAAEQMAQTMNDNLEGSLTLLSSAFDGFKKALYDKISAPMNDLVKQITASIVPSLTGIAEGVPGAEEKLADGISSLISNALKSAAKILPRAVGALGAVLGGLGGAIVRQAPAFTDGAVRLLEQILDGVPKALPSMVKGLGRIVRALASGLGELVPHLADSIIDAVPELLDALFEVTPVIFRALVRLVEKLTEKIPDLLLKITGYLPRIVQGVMDFITDFVKNNAPLVLKTAIAIAQAFVKAAPEIAKAIYPMIPQIMDMLVAGVMDFIPIWLDTARTMFGMLADAVPDLWRGVKDASATAFKEWKTNIFDRARDAFGEIWDHIKDKVTPVGKKIGDAVGGAFKGAVNAVLDHIEERLNSIPNAINGAIDLLNALPGVSISPMDTISLPRLAKGGIVNKSTLAQIGENGREAIIPLEKNKAGLREIARLLQGEMHGAAGSGAPGAPGASGKQGVTINLTQNNSSPKALSTYEIWRQSKNMADLIKLQLQGV